MILSVKKIYIYNEKLAYIIYTFCAQRKKPAAVLVSLALYYMCICVYVYIYMCLGESVRFLGWLIDGFGATPVIFGGLKLAPQPCVTIVFSFFFFAMCVHSSALYI